MRFWRSLAEVPSDLGRTVVTIGTFDGVHLGHQEVVRRARDAAGTLGEGVVVAVTFDPHPRFIGHPDEAPAALTSVERRSALLGDAGADAVVVVQLGEDIATGDLKRLVEEVVLGKLHAAAIVVGANFEYGDGDVAMLERLGRERSGRGETVGSEVVVVPLQGSPEVWSSSYVRHCLEDG